MEKNKIDWNKIVSESNGEMFFLPKEFMGAGEDWFKARQDYNDLVATMAEKELSLNMAFQNLIFEVRKYLKKNGHPDIFTKDMGFEEAALQEGKLIVNLRSADKSRMPLR